MIADCRGPSDLNAEEYRFPHRPFLFEYAHEAIRVPDRLTVKELVTIIRHA